MSDFLTTLVDRARGTAPVLRPLHPYYRPDVDSPEALIGGADPPAANRLTSNPSARFGRGAQFFEPGATGPGLPARVAGASTEQPKDAPEPPLSGAHPPTAFPVDHTSAGATVAEVRTPRAVEPVDWFVPTHRSSASDFGTATESPPRGAAQANEEPADATAGRYSPVPRPGNVADAARIVRQSLPSQANPVAPDSIAAGDLMPPENAETVEVEFDETVPVAGRAARLPCGIATRPTRRRAERPSSGFVAASRVADTFADAEAVTAPERHVTVTIGRLDVRVTGESAAPATARPTPEPAMSLQEYLRGRGGGS
jgi:hypothetical protein